jgi:hypothetical protein
MRIIDMGAVGGAFHPDDADLDWERRRFSFLEGFAQGDDGRLYAWELWSQEELRDGDEEEGANPMRVMPLGDWLPGAVGAYHQDSEFVALLVEDDWFDYRAVEALAGAPPEVKRLLFHPVPDEPD